MKVGLMNSKSLKITHSNLEKIIYENWTAMFLKRIREASKLKGQKFKNQNKEDL